MYIWAPDQNLHLVHISQSCHLAALITMCYKCTFTLKVLNTENDMSVELKLMHLYVLLFLHTPMSFRLKI